MHKLRETKERWTNLRHFHDERVMTALSKVKAAILAQAISLQRHVAHARCRRVLVIFRIEHWFACVRQGPVSISFCFSLSLGFLQVMSQPRRSARLAACFQQSASSLSVEIDLTDLDGFSDDMSDLASFSDNVPLPPAPFLLRLFQHLC